MRYRLTCLTPMLVGDGRKLSPIDYMVWKDQVNVLDQRRIFRLLAKGPRLEGYLMQLKKADKLDFASWGGFAQNFADRRLPFESPAYSAFWNRATGESLHIPTFAAGAMGPYLPGAAVKGALRTGMLFAALKPLVLQELAMRSKGDRPSRRPAETAEEQNLGGMRLIGVGDSAPVGYGSFKVYLLRTSTLQPRGTGSYALGWKQSPRGTADGRRPEDSTPTFAEMAVPGASFEGDWMEREFFSQPEIRRALRLSEPLDRAQIFGAVNDFAAALLASHREYATRANLDLLSRQLGELEGRVAAARGSGACVLSMGWGGGLLGKSAWIDTDNQDYRQVLRSLSLYQDTLRSGLPFPKTRRVVFTNNQPSTLPGWALLEVQ